MTHFLRTITSVRPASVAAVLVATVVLAPGLANADCYGRVIGGADNDGSLCQFASESPAYAPRGESEERGRYISSDDVFSNEERVGMVRDIIVGQGQSGNDRTGVAVSRGNAAPRTMGLHRRPRLLR